jgi:type IV secretion system protein VirB1
MILDEIILDKIIMKCSNKVAASTMKAIIKTESRGNPFAIGINGRFYLSYQPRNYKQAYLWLEYLEKHNYNIDIGIAQININNVHKYGYKAVDMLNPCTNIQLANMILQKYFKEFKKHNISDNQALFMAISAYNTGNYQKGFTNGYVKKVVNNARN